MKYVAVIALLTLAACSGGYSYAPPAPNYATSRQPDVQLPVRRWTGQEPYSTSEYAL